jgi:hypothetical protein
MIIHAAFIMIWDYYAMSHMFSSGRHQYSTGRRGLLIMNICIRNGSLIEHFVAFIKFLWSLKLYSVFFYVFVLLFFPPIIEWYSLNRTSNKQTNNNPLPTFQIIYFFSLNHIFVGRKFSVTHGLCNGYKPKTVYYVRYWSVRGAKRRGHSNI